MVERCLRCGQLGQLVPWPLARRVMSFGTAAVAVMGWRACAACVAFAQDTIERVEVQP